MVGGWGGGSGGEVWCGERWREIVDEMVMGLRGMVWREGSGGEVEQGKGEEEGIGKTGIGGEVEKWGG